LPVHCFPPGRDRPQWARASSLSIYPGFTITLSDTQLVVFLWASNQPDAETSAWQHTTPTRNRRPCSGGIWTRSPSKRAVEDPRLKIARPLGSGSTTAYGSLTFKQE